MRPVWRGAWRLAVPFRSSESEEGPCPSVARRAEKGGWVEVLGGRPHDADCCGLPRRSAAKTGAAPQGTIQPDRREAPSRTGAGAAQSGLSRRSPEGEDGPVPA